MGLMGAVIGQEAHRGLMGTLTSPRHAYHRAWLCCWLWRAIGGCSLMGRTMSKGGGHGEGHLGKRQQLTTTSTSVSEKHADRKTARLHHGIMTWHLWVFTPACCSWRKQGCNPQLQQPTTSARARLQPTTSAPQVHTAAQQVLAVFSSGACRNRQDIQCTGQLRDRPGCTKTR